MDTATVIKKTKSRTNRLKGRVLKDGADRKFSPRAFGILKNSFGKKKSADIISKIRKIGLILVTKNIKHFKGIKNLKILRPY